MTEEAEITVYGDKDCAACKDTTADMDSNLKGQTGIKYRYVDIESHEGHSYLDKKGVKEGQKTNIPQIKACKVEVQPDGARKKKCAEVDNYDKAKWQSLKEGRLPDLDFKEESE